MPTLSGQKVITNRQLNFTLSPVDLHNPKEMPHKLSNYEIDGTWNQHQSIILDSILDRIFRGWYSECKKHPTKWWDNNVVFVHNNFLDGVVNPKTISFLNLPPRDAYIKKVGFDDYYKSLEDKYIDLKRLNSLDYSFDDFVDKDFEGNREYQDYLVEMQGKRSVLYGDSIVNIDILKYLGTYSFIKNYKRSLKMYLKRISETKFKFNYKIKYIQKLPTYKDDGRVDSKGDRIDIFYNMSDYQSIFKVDFTDEKIVFNFESPLGKFILFNTLQVDTDYCPDEALSLSKNAYFLYKRFIMNRRMGSYKAKNITLKFKEICSFLDYQWKNEQAVHYNILKSLDDLEQKGLVKSHSWRYDLVKERNYELQF